MLYILKNWAELSGNALAAVVKNDLQKHADLRRYVLAVLDPSVTYGQSKMPFEGTGWQPWSEHLYDLLNELAARRLTGNNAKEMLSIISENYDEEACELLNRALKKDLRCGVGATLINNLGIDFKIPVFEVALCHPAEAKRFKGEDWLVGTKYDGMRALIDVNIDQVQFFTRSGKLIPKLDHLAADVLKVFGGWKIVLDAEAVSKSFLEGMSQLRGNGQADDGSVVLQIFDCLPREAFYAASGRDPVGDAPLWQRLNIMARHIIDAKTDIPSTLDFVYHETVTTYAEVMALAEAAWARGDEGVIARRAAAPYTKKRTHDWLKVKAENTYDGRIIRLHEGEGKYVGMLGAATVVIDGVESRIGGGWSDWERAAAWAAATGNAVNGIEPDPANDIRGRIIECSCHEKMPSGALRHGNKRRFRDIEGEKA